MPQTGQERTGVSMNLLAIVLVLFCIARASHGAPSSPCEQAEREGNGCDETEYEAYRTCIEESRGQHREKRQIAPCQLRVLEPEVQTKEPFEILVAVPPLKVVPPKGQRPELKNLDRTIIVKQGSNQVGDEEGDDEEGDFHYRLPVNVTTVIRLTNIVNNTNNIHMPTTLNNTNVNNIHIYSNLTQAAEDGDEDEVAQDDQCCTAVRPPSCHTSTQGVRCKRRKFQTCGPQCTAKVVHIQKRKRCSRSTGECQEKIAYVPQPEKPTCVYIDEWPYVVCGKRANMSVICAGCYDHYGRGYEAVHGNGAIQPQCIGCYDDAFDVGPLYRRGPVLRPFYYHQPPCYLSGSCPDSYDDNCGYGCYGHDRIDPAWGRAGPQDQFDPSMDASNTIYYDPDDLEVTNQVANDWGVPTAKCSVVTDGNTITVKNCTDSADNPFAAAPAVYPHYDKAIMGGKRQKPTSAPPAPTSGATTAPSTDGVRPSDGPNSTTTESPPTTISAQEKEGEEDDGSVTEPIETPDAQPDEDDESGVVEGSAAGPRNNRVSFVEEYVDDEDFML